MLRYNGDNVEEDVVPSKDEDHDLVPTSLDKDFQLSELSCYHNNTHCALNDDTLRLQHQLDSGTKTDGNGVVWPALTSKKRSVMKRYKGVTG